MSFVDFDELDEELDRSAVELVEEIASDLRRHGDVLRGPEEIVEAFVARTPLLTEGEQAELLGAVMEDQRTGSTPRTSPAPSGRPPARSGTTSSPTASRPGGSSSATGARTDGSSGTAGTRPATTTRSPAPAAGTPRPASTNGRSGGGSSRGGFDIGRYLQQGLDLFQRGAAVVQQGTQAIRQLSGQPSAPAADAPQAAPPPDAAQPDQPSPSAPGGDAPAPAAPAFTPSFGPPGAAPPAFAPGFGPPGVAPSSSPSWMDQLGQLGGMLQALRQGSIPALPALPAQPTAPSLPAAPSFPAPAPAPGPAGQMDATALLDMMMRNRQLQQALQWAAVLGPSAPRTVELSVPAPNMPQRTQQVPLGAALNALGTLLRRSMFELNAATREDDPEMPEYLLGEDGGFVVDPASSDDRAALVTHLFRIDAAARRTGQLAASEPALDDADAFAREAGFDNRRSW